MAKTFIVKRNSDGTTETDPINSPKMRYFPNMEAAQEAFNNGTLQVGEVVTIGEGNEATHSDATLPIGTIVSYFSNTIPTGWLLCDGAEFDVEKYPVLYSLLQDNHTPDLRGRAVMGVAEGGEVGESQLAQLPNITGSSKYFGRTHTFTGSDSGALYTQTGRTGVTDDGFVTNDNPSQRRIVLDASRAGASTDVNGNNVYTANGETRPANVRVNFIIKAVYGEVNEEESEVITDFLNTIDDRNKYVEGVETFTGRYWVDGKKIYRYVSPKCPNAITASTSSYGGSNPPSLSVIETPISHYIVDGKHSYPTVWNVNYGFLITSNNNTDPGCRYIIEYTKSTD